MIMKDQTFTLKFATPAFLGDAEQNGVWRTPPIKALLRQWWRVAWVAYAAQNKIDIAKMRHDEGVLFGHAWLEDDSDEHGKKVPARKSQVRLRLDPPGTRLRHGWTHGTQQGVSPLSDGLDTSYAWFGIIKRGNNLPDRTGIKADHKEEGVRVLRLAVPDANMERFEEVISLINAFGLLGSRSRGGWGALHVENVRSLSQDDMNRYARPLSDCLTRDWPASLAVDDKGICIWHSKESYSSWDRAMKFIATERKRVRSSLKTEVLDLRAALGFASSGRMASPLRWKVIPDGNAFKIRIFALPHAIPDDGGIRMTFDHLQKAWGIVCSTLDSTDKLVPRKK
jgi:CRISPR-associated protein Cmr1